MRHRLFIKICLNEYFIFWVVFHRAASLIGSRDFSPVRLRRGEMLLHQIADKAARRHALLAQRVEFGFEMVWKLIFESLHLHHGPPLHRY